MESWDYFCALCAGPMYEVEISDANSGRSTPDNASETGSDNGSNADEAPQDGEDDNTSLGASSEDTERDCSRNDEDGGDPFGYCEGFNPAVISERDMQWTSDCRVLGFNLESTSASKAFISGPGWYDNLGMMTCEGGDDPNAQGMYIPSMGCYTDFDSGRGVVFPFHWECGQLLCRVIYGSDDPENLKRLDKDTMYHVMRSRNGDARGCLEIEYDEPGTDVKIPYGQTWDPKEGQEFYATSPTPTPRLSAGVREDLARRSFKLVSLDKGLAAKVRSDPFSHLPREVTDDIVSSLDHRSLLRLFRASWIVHSRYHEDNGFWEMRLKNRMPWFFELHEYLKSGSAASISDMKALYLYAQKATKPRKGLRGNYMSIANRRRIWGSCSILADLYLAKISEVDASVDRLIRSQASCSHYPVITWPIDTDQTPDKVFWIRDPIEIEAVKTLETFWDTDENLLGISVTFQGAKTRLLGREYDRFPVRKESDELYAGEWINGLILHIPQLDIISGMPSTTPNGITVQTTKDRTLFFGETDASYCQRPLFPPPNRCIVGVMGEVGIAKLSDGGSRIWRIGLMTTPSFPLQETASLPDVPPTPELERYLWGVSTRDIRGKPIWEWGDTLTIRKFDGELVQQPNYDFHPDIIHWYPFLWAHDKSELQTLQRFSVHQFTSGKMIYMGGASEVLKGVGNLGCEFEPSSGLGRIRVRHSDVDNQAPPEDDLKSFEIDGPRGERIVEFSARAGIWLDAFSLRTNFNRGFLWKNREAVDPGWKTIPIPEDELMVGLAVAFRDPCGYNPATESYANRHTRLGHIAAITIKDQDQQGLAIR